MTQSENIVIINDKKFSPFILEADIKKLVRSLALQIRSEYIDKNPVFLVILKGSIFFAADLIREIGIECQVEAMQAKSYGAKMHSSGDVNLFLFEFDIKGRNVLIIEDIVDTGQTLKALYEELEKHSPASVEIVTLISKPEMRKSDVRVKYIGMEIPPVFIVGYGLDYDEKGRQLKDVYSIVNF
ncbi:MAG: hypoxanthine phosphoribosyltransferase [Candidatus Kapabacteria bacterium]|nr:hypoxanthine phosphoribosyltransferase [Candidatus Kapabacteria bacterium]